MNFKYFGILVIDEPEIAVIGHYFELGLLLIFSNK